MAEMSSSLVVTSAMDAPMSYSLGAMGPLLRKLDSLLPPDYRLPKLLKHRIDLLKADLEEISVALLEQSMVDSPNEMAKYWMNEVRALIYDIEDFIDNMMSPHADAKKRLVQSYKVGRVKIPWLPKARKPCTRAAKIAEFRTLVREASERHDRYLDGCISSSKSVFTGHARVPVLYAEAANNLVGIDDSKMKLIKWLTDGEEQQLKVVAIVGPAGVGKTTLAKQVYHELGEQFECRAFVRASRKPDMRRLLGGILSQVQGYQRPFDSGTVQDLIDSLTEHLQDKRYVIVIDDLWEKTAWDIVTSAFPEGNNHSRIMTTAEIEGVALQCCDYQSSNILKMRPLGREDSGELLFSLVFGPERLCPEQLNSALDLIITKCAGLPLATICVAGLLTSQPGNTELWQHVQECLCYNLSTNSSLDETLQEVLMLSYKSLPHYLKTCLMYLSMYPEGYTTWKVDLVKQWIAEGFICATEGTEMGEVADSYFGELVNRGMIQPVDINYNAEVLSCTLHHVVLDLIKHESNEENFITALDYSQTITGLYSKAHRLSLHFSNTRYATKPTGPTLSKVRSIGFFGIVECVPSVVEFKLLRVLILEFWGDHRGSTSFNLTRICKLVQLRYLKISCDATVEVELPTQVRMLRYLETLMIDAVVSAVPLDIIHLPGLWHLSLGNKIDPPDEIGRIRSLRTLHYFDVRSNSEENVLSLGDLMNLQDLHLTYYKKPDEHPTEESDEHLKRNLRALASSLGKLVNLKSVTLAPGASGTTIYLDVRSSMSSPPVCLQRLELLPPICIFSRLPEWIGQLQKLCILKVVVSELLMKDMDMLIGLPALTILSLYVRQPMTESIIFKRGAFIGLKYFKYTCGVLSLNFQEEAFPNLQRLELSFNAHRGVQYDHLLLGIDYLLNLKEIVGTIGAEAGAEEPDRRAAESAFKDAIRKHPRFPSYDNVKRVDRVCEDYQFKTQEKYSSSERHEVLQKEHRRKEGHSSDDQFRILLKETEEDTKQHSDRISHFPATGSIISFGQMKRAHMPEAVFLAMMEICSILGDKTAKAIVAKLSRKATNLKELPGKVEKIRKQLTMMGDVIRQIDTVYLTDKVVKSWIGEVRKVAYHVEDVIDKYSYHVLQLEEEGFLTKFFRGTHHVKVFNEIADEVVKLEKEIQLVIGMKDQWLQPYQLVVNPLTGMGRQLSDGSFPEFVRDEDLVGIEENRILLTGWLYSKEPGSIVITLSGMGGLGKSTLVRNVYERERIMFPAHAWIIVSQNCTVDALLRKLLWMIGYTEQPLSAGIDKMDVHDLKKKIHQRLENRKCLIVFDDVWEQDVYFHIHDVFQYLQGTRIIITTRKHHFAQICSPTCHLELQPLSKPDAFDLFCRRAFYSKKGNMCPQELETIASSIVDRCRGLPLAIVTIGSMLSSRQGLDIWAQKYNQLRRELSDNDHVRSILNLCYGDLSYDLQMCFLYCSLYPEGHPMSRDSLVRLWVAEGFVPDKEKNTLEMVAEANLMELIRRNMLQVVENDELGRVKTCKIHAILRDLAISIVKEERFASANDYGTMVQTDKDARRLSFFGWRDNAVLKPKLPHLRTVVAVGVISYSPGMLSSVLSESSYLTVLELQDSEVTEVPASIGSLFNLRYIGLRRTTVKSLPECIENLSNLHTLDIKQTKIEKLPRGIIKIKKLRHLLADRYAEENRTEFRYLMGMQAPKDLSNLEELQTLETVESSNDLAKQLKKLMQLRSVSINNISAADCAKLFATLSNMPFLSSLLLFAKDENEALCFETLKPRSTYLHRLIIRGQWAKGTLNCPIFLGHGTHLKHLVLSWCHLGEDPLGMLAPHLPNLTYLKLSNMHSANTLVLYADSFPNLTTLVLKHMPDVCELNIIDGALPRIECLYIVAMSKLNKVPCGIESLRSLKRLWLLGLHNDFRSQWDTNRMHQKILHVPEVRL